MSLACRKRSLGPEKDWIYLPWRIGKTHYPKKKPTTTLCSSKSKFLTCSTWMHFLTFFFFLIFQKHRLTPTLLPNDCQTHLPLNWLTSLAFSLLSIPLAANRTGWRWCSQCISPHVSTHIWKVQTSSRPWLPDSVIHAERLCSKYFAFGI